MPTDGIYVLFESGEESHGGDRIVRIGTHTGVGQLRSRLQQHFVKENKDRSVFRKNIGRCLLNRDSDPFLPEWEIRDGKLWLVNELYKEPLADADLRVLGSTVA